MKNTLSMAFLLFVGVACAEPTVSIDRVQQRYPWNGMVDIDYTVAGVINPAIYTIDLDVTDETGRLWDSVTLLSAPDTSPGSHRLTWDSAEDDAQLLAKKATFKLNLREIPVTAYDGDYMVIDLTSGSNSVAYNVTYLSDIADPTNFFNTAEYRAEKIVLKKIKAGSFWMGSPTTESYHQANEKLHYVTLTNDFFIGMFMLTGGQFNRVTGMAIPSGSGEEKSIHGNIGIGGYVELCRDDGFLSRLNARAFCGTTSIVGFNVPTEAQWEYACRAGTTNQWFFGDNESLLSTYAYYNNATAPRVGAKQPNPWCLWDMYGIQQEYVQDDYEADYPDTTESNPDIEPAVIYPNKRFNLVARGGAGWQTASACRSAYRVSTTSSTKSTSNGFRLAIPCHGTGGVTE